MNVEENFFDENLYFEQLRYEHEWRDNIFNESNGKIDLKNIRKQLNHLKQIKDEYTTKEILSLYESKNGFVTFTDYEDKLSFWKDKNLNLLCRSYHFKKKYQNEWYDFTMTIEPQNDKERNLYFIHLTEWLNNLRTTHDNVVFLSFEQLTYNYELNPPITEVFILNEIKKTKERINQQIQKEIFFTNKFIDGFRSIEGIIVDDLYSSLVTIDQLEIISYLLSPIVGFLKYETFLKQELKNKDFTEEIMLKLDKNEEREAKEVSKIKSFKRIDLFSEQHINYIRKELIDKNYIEKISFEDFLKIFDYRNLSEIKQKIIWKIPYKTFTENKPSYDWKSLLYLINELVEPDFNKFRIEIRDVIRECFDFPNGTLYNKSVKSFDTYVTPFKRKTKVESKKIDEIFNKLYN
jgi:hypothetical protein